MDTHAELRLYLENLPEDQLRVLLRDLLKAMGFRQVTITHGSMEYGRDLAFVETDKLGREIWRAVQAKSAAITGSLTSSDGLRAILRQCEAALDTPWTTPSGETVGFREVWLVTTTPLSEQAKASASGMMQTLDRIHRIDGPGLAELIERFLPDLLQGDSKPIDDYLVSLARHSDSLEPYISLRLGSKGLLSDFFVPPQVTVVFPAENLIRYMGDLTVRLGLPTLARDCAMYLQLTRSGKVPAVLHNRIASTVSRLWSVTTIAADSAQLGTSIDLAPVFELLALAVDAPLSGSSAPSLPELTKGQFGIDVLTFNHVKEEAVALIDSSLLWSDWEQPDQVWREVTAVYRSAVNPDSAESQLVIQLAALLTAFDLRQSAAKHSVTRIAVQEATLAPLVARVTEAVEKIDRALSERMTILWNELCETLKRLDWDELLTDDNIQKAVHLQALTRVIREFYPVPENALSEAAYNGVDLCSRAPRLAIIGELGLGKTSLLKQTARGLAQSSNKTPTEPLPAFCPLASVKAVIDPVSRSLLDVAVASFRGFENFAEEDVAWFLDGLDELQSAETRDKLIAWITSTSVAARRVVVSSRPLSVPLYLPNTMVARLQPLTIGGVESLVRRFEWEPAEDAEALLGSFSAAPELMDLARTPLLLVMIVMLAKAQGAASVPRRRDGVYRVVTDLLLGQWDVAKGIRRTRTIADRDLEIAILGRVAYRLYMRRRRSFTREEFIDECSTAFSGKPLASEQSILMFGDLLRDCLIVPFGAKEFAFFHFSIQEYLAAVDLASDVGPTRTFDAMHQFFEDNGWWEEVLVFYAAIKRDISTILEGFHKKSVRSSIGQTLNPDYARLLHRMLNSADLTDVHQLEVHGPVAWAFAELNVGGLRTKWQKYR